jgi:hypothetical protein
MGGGFRPQYEHNRKACGMRPEDFTKFLIIDEKKKWFGV